MDDLKKDTNNFASSKSDTLWGYDAVNTIKEADAFIILTGAGMGVDSGLATFRGPTAKGWTHSKTGKDIDYYDICQGKYFSEKDNPMREEAMKFWESCRESYNTAKPHEGYSILMKWISNHPYMIYTTNVDCHWKRVGVPANQVYEIHGSVEHLQCSYPKNNECMKVRDWNTTSCPGCNGQMRPNILMFLDGGYIDDHQLEIRKKYTKFIKDNADKKVVLLVIGAGTVVPTIKYEVEMLLRKLPNAVEIKINPDVIPTDFAIAMGALAGLKDIDKRLNN